MYTFVEAALIVAAKSNVISAVLCNRLIAVLQVTSAFQIREKSKASDHHIKKLTTLMLKKQVWSSIMNLIVSCNINIESSNMNCRMEISLGV